MNNPRASHHHLREAHHFEQANAHLKLLDQQRYDGQIDHAQYQQQRYDILRFLSGEDLLDAAEAEATEQTPRKRRWWWPLGR